MTTWSHRATLRWPRRLLLGNPLTAGQPRSEGSSCAEAGWRDVHKSLERLACKVHRPNVRPAHDDLEFVVGNPHHQVATDDTAAHPAAAEKGETAEHLPFSDVSPLFEHSANSLRESFVVRHEGVIDSRHQTPANGFSSALGPYTDGTGMSSSRK